MPYFDSHAHLDIAAAGDPQIAAALLQRALRAGVRAILVPAVASNDWENLLKLAPPKAPKASPLWSIHDKPQLFVALGIHPWAVLQKSVSDNMRDLSHLSDRLQDDGSTNSLGISAIGECGLDYLRGPSQVEKRKQRDIFITHLNLAKLTKLPLVMHCVGAYGDLLGLLRDYGPTLPPSVVHGFTGKAGLAEQISKLGHYIGVGGAVSYPRFRHLRQAVPEIPLSQMLLESDAPDQTPRAFQGQANEPSFVPVIAAEIAKLRGCSVETIAEATTQNACRFLGIPDIYS